MLWTKIDPLWAKECQAVQLQALPPPDILRNLLTLQDYLQEILCMDLRRIPPESLHCTIFTPLHPAQLFDRSKFDIWDEHAELWTTAFFEAISRTPTFELCFDRVVLSEVAIIVTAAEPQQLRDLRTRLSHAISYRGWHPKPPDIAHLTIFRYNEVRKIPSFGEVGHRLPFRMQVNRIRLIKEIIYPTLQHLELASFDLGI